MTSIPKLEEFLEELDTQTLTEELKQEILEVADTDHTVTQGEQPAHTPLPEPTLEGNSQVILQVRVLKTGQFMVSGPTLKEELRFHSEWQLAAFFTEMSKHGKLKNLKPFSKSQTYDEWLAAGNVVKVIKPSETKPVPKDEAGKVTITLEDLGL